MFHISTSKLVFPNKRPKTSSRTRVYIKYVVLHLPVTARFAIEFSTNGNTIASRFIFCGSHSRSRIPNSVVPRFLPFSSCTIVSLPRSPLSSSPSYFSEGIRTRRGASRWAHLLRLILRLHNSSLTLRIFTKYIAYWQHCFHASRLLGTLSNT